MWRWRGGAATRSRASDSWWNDECDGGGLRKQRWTEATARRASSSEPMAAGVLRVGSERGGRARGAEKRSESEEERARAEARPRLVAGMASRYGGRARGSGGRRRWRGRGRGL